VFRLGETKVDGQYIQLCSLWRAKYQEVLGEEVYAGPTRLISRSRGEKLLTRVGHPEPATPYENQSAPLLISRKHHDSEQMRDSPGQTLKYPWALIPEFCTQSAVNVESAQNCAEPRVIRKGQLAHNIVSRHEISE